MSRALDVARVLRPSFPTQIFPDAALQSLGRKLDRRGLLAPRLPGPRWSEDDDRLIWSNAAAWSVELTPDNRIALYGDTTVLEGDRAEGIALALLAALQIKRDRLEEMNDDE